MALSEQTRGGNTEQGWLATIRAQVLRGDIAHAEALLTQALTEHPSSLELCRVQAGIFQQKGLFPEAEALFQRLLSLNPCDRASAFSLARLLKEQGRMAQLASILRRCFD